MFEAFQTAIFDSVAEQLRDRFPHKSLSIVVPSALIYEDLELLRKTGRIKWDPFLKTQPFFELDNVHPIRLVVYYRGNPVGYAFGGYRKSHSAVEICWMEKRNDAHEDLDHQMLGIALDAYSAYAIFLRAQEHKVDKIALVNPIEGVRRYYQDSNFKYVDSYNGAVSAMILTSN